MEKKEKTLSKVGEPLRLNGRIWIETENGRFLGKGRIELLERIMASGSIRQAALQMKMSYKQAWDLVNEINAYFNEPVVLSHRGGKGGGSAEVTEKGLYIIEEFKILQAKFFQFLEQNQHLTAFK